MPCPERTVRRPRRPGAARGVALVSVLLIVALASALAYQMLSRHGLTIAHSEQLLRGGQAREYALAAEAFARQLLAEDWSDEATREADTLLEPWAEPSPPFEIEDGEIALAIVDLNARFNLNGVIGRGGPDNVQRLKQLVTNLELPPVIADTWVDWVDPDSDVNAAGAEDETYLLSVPAYRAANQPVASTSELLAVRDVTPDDYAALRPHVAWLPETNLRVNVNTAGYEVLRCLAPGLSEEEAETLIESDREFQEVAEVTAQHAALGNSVAAIAVMSEYFEVRVRAEVADTRVSLASMLHRDPTTGRVRLLARDFGGDFQPVTRPAGERDDAYAEDALAAGDAPVPGSLASTVQARPWHVSSYD